MIVIDNFIQDEVLLAAIENDKDFFGPNGNYTWWDGWFNSGVYGPNEGVQELGTHFDKDELHWERTGGSEGGEVLRPEIGTVYYPKDVPFTGGYLEIEHPDGVMERIQAKYNRLIIFDAGTCLHRVTPVESGTRYAIAINLWDHIPVAAQEGSMNIE